MSETSNEEKMLREVVALFKDAMKHTPNNIKIELQLVKLQTDCFQQIPKKDINDKMENNKMDNLQSSPCGQVSYQDIGGMADVIAALKEVVEVPFHHPELFERLGIEPPKGVLLHGPPGAGKTLVVKAIANESGANFFSLNGPELMSNTKGEPEDKLREIFEEARLKAPSIIFIDELEAIARKREHVTGDVERRVVAQLLTLMDGVMPRGKVMVIGATNLVDQVDSAFRRPGRFDRLITIRLPDTSGRLEILKIHTKRMPLASDVDLHTIATMTENFSGAQLAGLCREAAMRATRRWFPCINVGSEKIPDEILNKILITMDDFKAIIATYKIDQSSCEPQNQI